MAKPPLPMPFANLSIGEIATMDRSGLLTLWAALIPTPVPNRISQKFLRRILAYALQVQRSHGLPAGFVAKLTRQAADAGRVLSPALKPGGRFLREWNGTTHVVEVVEGGYLWNGHRHRSLSVIAKTITGAHWSGPRFFGLAKSAAEVKATAQAQRRSA